MDPSRGKAKVTFCMYLLWLISAHVIYRLGCACRRPLNSWSTLTSEFLNGVCNIRRRECHSRLLSDGTGSIGAPPPFRSIRQLSHPPGQRSTLRSCQSASCSGWAELDGTGRRLLNSATDADTRQRTTLSCRGTVRNFYRTARGGDLLWSGSQCNSKLCPPNAH